MAALALGALLAAVRPGWADDPPDEESALAIHGFVSQGFIKTTANNYLASSERGSFELSEAGLNVTQRLTDRLRVGTQLFARKLGSTGTYTAKFDWFYLDYRVANWLGIRAGRTKIPFGLYNEVNDVDSARVPVLLPQSIYPTANRDFLLAQSGVELYGYVTLGGAGALDYRLYGGTIYVDATTAFGPTQTVQNLTVPYVAGGRVMWETPLEGLRTGVSVQALRLDANVTIAQSMIDPLISAGLAPAGFNGVVGFQLPAFLWVASIEYAAHDWLVAAEYSRWHTRIDITIPELVPANESESDSDRMYALVAYRVTPWFYPGAYYSLFFPNASTRNTTRDSYQNDAAVTLRFDVNDYWLFKLEGHYMLGTAGLSSALNDNTPLIKLTRSWAVLLLKTTVSF